MASFVAKLDFLQQQLVFLPYVLNNNEGNTVLWEVSFDFSPKMNQTLLLICLHKPLTETDLYSWNGEQHVL